MFNMLRAFIENYFDFEGAGREDPQTLCSLAAAALMVEVIASDYETTAEELEALDGIVRRQFGLGEQEAAGLIERARQAHTRSTDYFQFTSVINESCTPAQKVMLVEALWRVAYADRVLHRYEEHVIRRIADLIYVPHIDFIASKHRVLEELEEKTESL